MSKHLTPEEIADKWAENEVQLPRIPFFLINLYQFMMPIFVIMIVDGITFYFYVLLHFSVLLQMILFPFLFISNMYLSIWSMSKFCRILHLYWNQKSPAREAVYSRKFKNGNVADPAVHYYHLRGFMYKWPVWVAKKSFFPWMINFVLRDMADNEIHENAMYGDCYVSLEFTDLQDQSVVMEGSCISSHVVDSIFGNLTVKKVIVEKQGVLHATGVMAPGGIISDGMAVGPRSFVVKHQHVKNDDANFVWGTPARKFGYSSFYELMPEDFKSRARIVSNRE